MGGVVTGEELYDHGELPGSVYGHVRSVEASYAVGVVVTAVFITNIIVMRGFTAAEWPAALVWAGDVAWVRSESRRGAVCLPQVHFVAARTVCIVQVCLNYS